jgi:hypothetical protein
VRPRLAAENANALRHDGYANAAISCAAFGLAAAVGALSLLTAPHGNIRASLVFWMLVVAYGVWFAPVLNFRARALGRLPLTLVASPLLAAAAMGCAAAGFVVRDAAGMTIASPSTLGWLTAVSALLCGAGYLALRRSALPGGGIALVPLPIAPLVRSAIVDTSLLGTLDADGEPQPVTSSAVLAAAPLWGILGSLWCVGTMLNYCWYGALGFIVLPQAFQRPVALTAVVALVAAFIAYVRCYRAFGNAPNVTTRNALARFFAGTLLAFAAFPCVQAFLVSPRSGTSHTLGLDEIALGLALVPACAVGYALYRIMHLDLAQLASEGYRR